MRTKTMALPAVLACCLMASGAQAPVAAADVPTASAAASGGEVTVRKGDRGRAVRALQRQLGITADGVFGPQTARAVRRFQRRNGLVADGVVGPLTRRALGLRPFSAGSVRRPSGGGGARPVRVPAILHRIAQCESGGDPRAVSADGQYRGKYQFSLATWRGLGGRGDPARASERRQDRMALKLYRLSGTAPWPTCGA